MDLGRKGGSFTTIFRHFLYIVHSIKLHHFTNIETDISDFLDHDSRRKLDRRLLLFPSIVHRIWLHLFMIQNQLSLIGKMKVKL